MLFMSGEDFEEMVVEKQMQSLRCSEAEILLSEVATPRTPPAPQVPRLGANWNRGEYDIRNS